MVETELEPGDVDDELPPLVGEDGKELPLDEPTQLPSANIPLSAEPERPQAEATVSGRDRGSQAVERGPSLQLPDGVTEDQALKAVAALHAKRLEDEAKAAPVTEFAALHEAIQETEGPKPEYKEPKEVTKRMVAALTKDDFEECEDAIMQGADLNADCGGGMKAIHIAALRGEMLLTELLLSHGASINDRDMSGNTPLIYTCHFARQHGRGVQMVAQLLYHKADPFFRVKDGKMAGTTAFDIVDKACREPWQDEAVPRQMRAMIQLALDRSDEGSDAITKMWMNFKSSNKKLFDVSSKRDKFDYNLQNVAWQTPVNAKNALPSEPKKIDIDTVSIVEERFMYLKEYSFIDEGDKVKVYVSFPSAASESLKDSAALSVEFEFQAFDLKLRTAEEQYRLRIDLFGSIEVEQCKHRTSSSSHRVTLTLVKRHKTRHWSVLLKPR